MFCLKDLTELFDKNAFNNLRKSVHGAMIICFGIFYIKFQKAATEGEIKKNVTKTNRAFLMK